jgi:membrane protease YdiL (CAAX protease family)
MRILRDLAIAFGVGTLWISGLLLFPSLPVPGAVLWVIGLTAAFLWRYARDSSRVNARYRADTYLSTLGSSSGWILAGMPLVAAFGQLLDVVYRRIPLAADRSVDLWSDYAARPAGLIPIVIVVVLAVPILEEFLFRGWIQSTLYRWGRPAAIGVASLLFAAVHMDLVWIPYFFLAGAVLGAAVSATGSIWAGILLHAAHNATCMLLEPWFPTPESMDHWTRGWGLGAWSAPVGLLVVSLLLWEWCRKLQPGTRTAAPARQAAERARGAGALLVRHSARLRG